MDASVQVRPAVVNDVEAILPMVAKVAAFHEALDPAKYGYLPGTAERYRRWLAARAQDARSVLLVAEDRGRLVGFIVGTVEQEIPIYRLKEFGFLHDLWVEEELRRGGVARALVNAAIGQFKTIGVAQVRCDVLYENTAARKLLESCGMRPSTVEMLIEL